MIGVILEVIGYAIVTGALFLAIICLAAFVDQELFDGAIFRTLDNIFDWVIDKYRTIRFNRAVRKIKRRK